MYFIEYKHDLKDDSQILLATDELQESELFWRNNRNKTGYYLYSTEWGYFNGGWVFVSVPK